jgi:methylmalonyl-CoA mutase cobalamin-binding domain/chain
VGIAPRDYGETMTTTTDSPTTTPTTGDKPTAHVRIVLAKVGLDGHDRGIKVVARGLRDAGFHVIYGGIWQSPDAVAQAVLDEDAQWLGISLLNGAHLTLIPQVVEALRQRGLLDVRLVLGGIVPPRDIPDLRTGNIRCRNLSQLAINTGESHERCGTACKLSATRPPIIITSADNDCSGTAVG